FWTSALFMKILQNESFVPMRLVSIFSTIATLGVIYGYTRWLLRRSGLPKESTRVWGIIAAGVLLSAYRFTGAWFDIERLDMLFVALTMGGIFLLDTSVEGDELGLKCSPWRATGGVILLSLAFFTKQQAILVILGSLGALIWMKRWKLVTLVTLESLVFCAGGMWLLNRATDGWFGFYCFKVPLGNGIQANLITQFFKTDLLLFAPMIALTVLGWLKLRPMLEQKDRMSLTLFGALVATSLLGSLLSRAHWGGDTNVLIPAYLILGMCGVITAAHVSSKLSSAAGAVNFMLAAQMLLLFYLPMAQVPTEANVKAGEMYQKLVHATENFGPVLCIDHGSFTHPPHFHVLGLLDILRAEKQMPLAISDALRQHKYAAIFTDSKPSSTGMLADIAINYPNTVNMLMPDTWVVTGFLTPGPNRSVWVSTPDLGPKDFKLPPP
ncbi:MAG: hypothetical protein ABJA67_14755, partial [Chthonomonadales bacterium]